MWPLSGSLDGLGRRFGGPWRPACFGEGWQDADAGPMPGHLGRHGSSAALSYSARLAPSMANRPRATATDRPAEKKASLRSMRLSMTAKVDSQGK